MFLNVLFSQDIDSSINIADFQYPELHGIPVILDETGENTFYLNEQNPEFISDGKINQIRLDGSLGIPLGSYFFPKLLPKSSQADSVKNTSQIYYRKGDYDYSDLGIGLQIESSDSGLFSFQAFKRSPPHLYQNTEDELQNYLFTIKRKLENSNLEASILYHFESVDLPVELTNVLTNVNREVESFHGGVGIEHSWKQLTIEAEQAYQFTYSNRWDNKVSYFTIWNHVNSTYQFGEDIKFHLQHNVKIHSTELNDEVIDVSYQVHSSLVEYAKQVYSVQVGFSSYKSSIIPIASLNWNWKNYYLSAKSNYEVIFLQDTVFITKVIPFSTDALLFGDEDEGIMCEGELFHIQHEKKSNLGVKGKAEISFSWIDIRHATGLYNLGSDNSSIQPIDMFSNTALTFSPNVWLWKSARYQPFIGAEYLYMKHSGKFGFDPMSFSIFDEIRTFDTFSSYLMNMEMGLFVGGFKISYRWVKFNKLNNYINNSVNPNSYPVQPIRHLEIVWQFWN